MFLFSLYYIILSLSVNEFMENNLIIFCLLRLEFQDKIGTVRILAIQDSLHNYFV